MYFYCSYNCELFGFPILLDEGYSINASCVIHLRSTGVISGAGTAYLPEHLNSPSVFSGVRVNRCLALYVCFIDRCLFLFLLAIVLSVLLRFTDSDGYFGIFKLFFSFSTDTTHNVEFQFLIL